MCARPHPVLHLAGAYRGFALHSIHGRNRRNARLRAPASGFGPGAQHETQRYRKELEDSVLGKPVKKRLRELRLRRPRGQLLPLGMDDARLPAGRRRELPREREVVSMEDWQIAVLNSGDIRVDQDASTGYLRFNTLG